MVIFQIAKVCNFSTKTILHRTIRKNDNYSRFFITFAFIVNALLLEISKHYE